MNIAEIFKDSLIYPTKDLGKLVALGALMVILVVLGILTSFTIIMGQSIASIILSVITIIAIIIIGLIYNGYSLSIIKETIENRQISENIDNLPDFNWVKNIIDGIKVLILKIIYMIIPLIVTIILAYVLGIFTDVAMINQYLANSTNISLVSNSSSIVFLRQFNANLSLVQGIATILALIFSLFAIIAQARLAETSKLSSVIEFREIFDSITKIGWGNYIVWFILLIIILFIIGIIASLIVIIPIIGLIIYFLIVVPFLIIFASRATGLIYNEQNKENNKN